MVQSETVRTDGSNTTVPFHLDTILEKIGNFGTYQITRLILILLIIYSVCVCGYSFVFYSKVPDYRCFIPECENFTENLEYNPKWLVNAVPFLDNLPKKCDRFQYIDNNLQCSVNSFNRSDTVENCDRYVFNTKFEGIAKEFQIYCDDKLWMFTLPATAHFIGLMVSLPFVGYFSDRFGRKTILLTLSLSYGIVSELQTFLSFNYWILLAFEFSRGAIGSGIFPTAYILILELMGPKHRTLGSFLTFSVGVMGEISIALIAMSVPNWRIMIQLAALPSLFVVFYGWIVPESIRWLLAKKKFVQANDAIKKMAGKKAIDLELSDFNSSDISKEKQVKERFREMFQSCALVFRICACGFCWITCVFLFYGITLGAVTIFGNMYLNFILVGLMEVPGNLGTLVFSNKIGRKKTLFAAYFLSGLACWGFILLEEDNWIKTVVYMLGKCSITAAFNCVYIYTTELFPTPFRQRIMGFCSSIGRIGSISASQMPFLANIWKSLPHLIFGSFAMFAAVLTLSFPETLNTKLPDTIDEAVNIGKTIDKNAELTKEKQ